MGSIGESDVQDGESFQSHFLKIEEITVKTLTGSVGQTVIDKIDDALKLYMNSFHRILVKNVRLLIWKNISIK